MNKTNDVIGLGHTLMDFVIQIDEDKLLELNLIKGESNLVDHDRAAHLLDKLEQHNLHIEKLPGGSVANTLRGIGILGGSAILCGVVGNDEHGTWYEEEIKRHHVSSCIKKHSSLTGHALAFVTPDSERTFSVHLGASVHMVPEDILEEDIAKSKVLHLEAYQLDSAVEALLHAIRLAKEHGTMVSMDLSDPGLIRRHRKMLEEILPSLDIVFVNEKEAKEFTGKEEMHAALELGKKVGIAIVKLGEKGSLIVQDGNVVKIPSFPANVIDTNGAGDTFAAGFLFGYCHGWNLEKAGKLGSLFAAKVVGEKGVRVSHFNGEKLKKEAERA